MRAIEKSEIIKEIRAMATEMSNDNALLADSYEYSCCTVVNRVSDLFEARYDLSQREKARLYAPCNEHVEEAGLEFVKTVIADSYGVLGFILPEDTIDELQDDFDWGLAGAFVHAIARAYGPLNKEHFVAARKAWLKFLSQYEGK
ncbi:hypothetical protein vBValMR10Z_377 [Vibrio phage vB_ValM_R10Z]|nr:hypothetical protein vBValMR10Z_377 [Vibrio phage vB_ValM_R10Z]